MPEINRAAFRALELLVRAGYTSMESIGGMSLDDAIKLRLRTSDLIAVNELQKSIKEKRFFEFLIGMNDETALPEKSKDEGEKK